MKEGLRRFYAGEYNTITQDVQADGTRIVTLKKDGDDKVYKFRVKDLCGENEEVLEHEVIEQKVPKHIADRMKEAKGGKPEG